MIGELINYYAIADIVFVGGSLVKKGGHNILEPAALAKPVLFGPYMFNFRDIAGLFLSVQAAIAVRNPQELKDKISDLLAHPELAAQLGGRARETLFKHQGASRKNSEFLSFFLPQV
jgi:3-deoxy-D-manno-octulosonic-acid transferase